jgi:hypothetical protein
MKEIVVVTQNRAGLLADISEILAAHGINIETIDADEIQDTAVIELTVDRYDEALQSLRDAGFHAVTEDALLVRLKDEPGALAKIARRFKDANIDLRSVRFIRRQEDYAFVALATDRTDEARALVKEYLVNNA